jgi:hypothetical protein
MSSARPCASVPESKPGRRDPELSAVRLARLVNLVVGLDGDGELAKRACEALTNLKTTDNRRDDWMPGRPAERVPREELRPHVNDGWGRFKTISTRNSKRKGTHWQHQI